MANDIFKRAIPSNNDLIDIEKVMGDYSASDHAWIPVGTATEIENIRSQAPASAFPLFFWNKTSGKGYEVTNSSASAREICGYGVEDWVQENSLYIDGAWYQASGTTVVPSFTLREDWAPIYAGTVTFQHPYTPPAGYGFAYFSARSTGFTALAVAGHNETSTTCRVIQIGHVGTTDVFTRASWQLIKINA